MNKYRISDLVLDSLKAVLLTVCVNIVGFVAYAASVGHIMMDKQIDVLSKHNSLMFFSGVMTVAYLVFLYIGAKKNIARKTDLIKCSREDDFDAKLYYKQTLQRTVLPLFIGGIVTLLPYTVFYTRYGWDYLYPSLIDRFYSTGMLFLGTFGGVLGSLIYNMVISGAYAAFLYKMQKEELADRMWLKDAPKQEEVKLNKPKDRYKDY